jgi:hypothetical protein
MFSGTEVAALGDVNVQPFVIEAVHRPPPVGHGLGHGLGTIVEMRGFLR